MREAMPATSNGIKTLKPVLALRPMPKAMALDGFDVHLHVKSIFNDAIML